MIRELIERTTGMPLISHGGENLILKEIQRGIRTKISSADYYYYILILHNTILWRLIFLLTTKRTKNRTNSNERGRSFWRRQKEPKNVPTALPLVRTPKKIEHLDGQLSSSITPPTNTPTLSERHVHDRRSGPSTKKKSAKPSLRSTQRNWNT